MTWVREEEILNVFFWRGVRLEVAPVHAFVMTFIYVTKKVSNVEKWTYFQLINDQNLLFK